MTSQGQEWRDDFSRLDAFGELSLDLGNPVPSPVPLMK